MLANKAIEVLDGIVAALDGLRSLDMEALDAADVLKLAERCETAVRRAIVTRNDLAVRLARCNAEDVGGPAHRVLADWLRITPAEARRRVTSTEPLRTPTILAGEPLAARQPATAAAWRRGELDEQHVRVIQRFFAALPNNVSDSEKSRAEAFLADHATALRPDQLTKVADRLVLTLNPDGNYSDEDRARRRGFTWGPQDLNGMSAGRLYATPELRASLDAWFAKFAAPGMCNPADESPTTTGAPTEKAINTDTRTTGQRQHDALTMLVRGQLGDPKFGQHNGLPVTIIATATLQDLEMQAGHATTGGGTRLPIADLIRMAGHAQHYLSIFDAATSKPLYLGRTKRVASADQRLVLHAKDRGCTYPGCNVPGYLTESHHVEEWSHGGQTNVDNLTLACGRHHRLVKSDGWKTRKTALGQTEWIPPPQLPLIKGGINTYHHPEALLDSTAHPRMRE